MGYFEISVKNNVIDKKGNDKEVVNKYVVEGCELFAEAEQKGLSMPLNDPDVVAIRQSAIKEFANDPTGGEGEAIYIATIVDTFIKENGDEKKTKYKVALFAVSTTNANKIVQEYMAQGLENMDCEEIKKTSFIDVI